MKRLSTERQPEASNMPDVYKQEVEAKVEAKSTEKEALPKSKVYSSLKKLSTFKTIKSNYKLQTQKQIFVSDVQALLSHLDKNMHKMDIELLVEVLNASESYFVYGSEVERNTSKSEAVHELMIDFFESNDVLTKFISVLDSKVTKSTFLRRCVKRVANFFF
jgi:hypothetical protein